MSTYEDFVVSKQHRGADSGFEPIWLPKELFDFQQLLTTWALRKGRAAIFADCGTGKTAMQLSWAENVVRKTNKPVLLLTPLSVGPQTILEAEKFGIEAKRSLDGKVSGVGIVVTNYERLHYFDRSQFSGVVCDESGILKNFEGATKAAITEFMKLTPYRLLCTATAAPNDYIELGTSSEALGYMGYSDMLTRFFKNDNNSIKPFTFKLDGRYDGGQWRFKGHAERPFWRWVCSWARALRKPSDVGCDDSRFVLPPLTETEHVIEGITAPGMLFPVQAVGLAEQRKERARTLKQRCAKAAELVNDTGKPALVWCHLNAEGDALAKLIPDAVQVSGNDSDDEKEAAFTGFVNGDIRVIITKPSIGAWGMNFQHCAHQTMFPSHSFEQMYQCVRRSHRFGQNQPVQIDMITSHGERGVLANLQRKARNAELMFDQLIKEMNQELGIGMRQTANKAMVLPDWLNR